MDCYCLCLLACVCVCAFLRSLIHYLLPKNYQSIVEIIHRILKYIYFDLWAHSNHYWSKLFFLFFFEINLLHTVCKSNFNETNEYYYMHTNVTCPEVVMSIKIHHKSNYVSSINIKWSIVYTYLVVLHGNCNSLLLLFFPKRFNHFIDQNSIFGSRHYADHIYH